MAGRIADLPQHERPRERLLHIGPQALADRELLAVLLHTGTRKRSALTLAEELLTEHGGLAGLARIAPEELTQRAGIGRAKSATVVAALELARRVSRAPDTATKPVRGPADLAALVLDALSRQPRERVLAVVLDRGCRPLRIVQVSVGSVERSLLPVREVLNAVLRCDGVAFALAHNHPSGDPSPSEEDITATRRIQAAAPLVGLKLLDHVIVTEGSWLSLRQIGALSDGS